MVRARLPGKSRLSVYIAPPSRQTTPPPQPNTDTTSPRTMPARTGGATLTGMLDDFSEDEFARSDALLTPDSAVENRAPARKGTRTKAETKPTVSKTAKAKTTARRASGASVLGPKKAAVAKNTKATAKRSALVEKQANASDTEEVDEFDDAENMKRAAGEPPLAAKGAKPAKRGRGKAKVEEVVEEESEIVEPVKKARGRPPKAAATKKAPAKKAASPAPEEIVSEIQGEPDPMDIEASIEMDEVPETQPVVRASQRSGRQPSLQPISSTRPRPAVGTHRRAGSASDTERGDPLLRRKLGEMTKRFENIDLKYKQLREAGVTDKASNFDMLKKTTDKREKGMSVHGSTS